MFKIFLFHLLLAFSFLLVLIQPDNNLKQSSMQIEQASLLSKTIDTSYYPFPKIVWLYWDKELMEPEILMFKQYYKQTLQNSGWTLNFIHDNNIKDFLSNQEQIDFILHSQQKTVGSAQKSDYLRLCILYEHGGLYLDFTSILHQNLTWFTLQNLIKNPLILNKHPIHSPEPDVLFTHQPIHGYRRNYKDSSTNYTYNDFPGYQSYFIVAKKNVQFFKQWKEKLKEYLVMQCQEVFMDLKNDDTYLADFQYGCYFVVYFAMNNVLKNKQQQMDRQSPFFGRINAHLYYKIWSFQCNYGPCIPFKGIFRDYYFLRSQAALLKEAKIAKIQLLTKFTSLNTKMFKNILRDSKQLNSLGMKGKGLMQIYQIRKQQFKDCRRMHYLNQQSIIYKKFNKYFHLLPYEVFSFSDQQCQQYWKLCRHVQPKQQIIHSSSSFKEEIEEMYETQFQGNKQFFTFFYIVVKARTCWLLIIIIKSVYHAILAYYNEGRNSSQVRELKANTIQFQISTQQAFALFHNPKTSEQQELNQFERLITKIHSFLLLSYVQNYLQQKFYRVYKTITNCTPYQIVSLLVLRNLLQYSYTFETQKQQFEAITSHMLFYFIIRKFNINQALKNKDNQNWFGFYSIESAMFKIVMSRIFLEMIYFQPQSVLFGSCYLYFALLVIEILEHEKTLFHFKFFLFIQKHRKHAKKVHQILFVMFLLSILLIPNIRYYQIFGFYILQAASNLTIIYAWILGLMIIIEEVSRFICFKLFSKLSTEYFLVKKIEVKFGFKNSQRIVFFYFTLLVLSILFNFMWFGYFQYKQVQQSFYLLKFLYFWFLSCSNYSIPDLIDYKNKKSHLFLSKIYQFVGVIVILLIYYFKIYLAERALNRSYHYKELMKQAGYYFNDLFVYIIEFSEYMIFYVVIQSCFQIDKIIGKCVTLIGKMIRKNNIAKISSN